MGAEPPGRPVRPLRPGRRSRRASTPSSSSCAETFRRELLAKIPDGTWTWEDYAEHDGVDEPRLHTPAHHAHQDGRPAACSTSPAPSPQAKGPINHAGDYADGNFLKKWLAPDPAQPGRHARAHGRARRQRGRGRAHRHPLPAARARWSRRCSRRPTNARTFVILRLLGVLAGVIAKAVDGYMPADQETIRYTGISGPRRRGPLVPQPRDPRRRLGRPLLRRRQRHDPRGARVPQPAGRVRRDPVPGAGRALGLATDSGGAGPVPGRAGLPQGDPGPRTTPRSCRWPTARSCRAGACGAAGRARRSGSRIDPGGPAERVMPGLCDWEPVAGRRGHPHRDHGRRRLGRPARARPVAAVALDVAPGQGQPRAAADGDYGVVLAGADDGRRRRRAPTPSALRARLARRARPTPPMFDRGPGYPASPAAPPTPRSTPERAQRANHLHSALLGTKCRWLTACIPKGAPVSYAVNSSLTPAPMPSASTSMSDAVS